MSGRRLRRVSRTLNIKRIHSPSAPKQPPWFLILSFIHIGDPEHAMPLEDQSLVTFPDNAIEQQVTSLLQLSLSVVRLALPSFWPKNPDVWFAQVKAQFHFHVLLPS